jgi:hypothetical protein
LGQELAAKFNPLDINETDVCNTFDLPSAHSSLDTKEYTKLCKDYFKVEHCLSTKLRKIQELKEELDEMKAFRIPEITGHTAKLAKSIVKTNKKLAQSVDTSKQQSEKITELSGALSRIDDIIASKSKFIESLELELQRLEGMQQSGNENSTEIKIVKASNEHVQTFGAKKSLAYTSTSSTSSTSSVFTSISSISSSQAANYNFPTSNLNPNLNKQQLASINSANKQNFVSYAGDNESDTGISSANSDDFNTQLETLV